MPMKILLIDDEPFVLKVLTRQLSVLGHTDVICHQDAREALRLLESMDDSIDLIFCDLQMPLMDGVEFVRHLVQIDYNGSLVLVSGENKRILQTVEKLAKGQQLQVLGALNKPVLPEQLRQVLESYRAGVARAPLATHAKRYGADELRRAIANGELENYYQPKVSIASGELVGVETLVRWRHPTDGLVFPDQFIATAEENNLIDDLTATVLTEALDQARRWQADGLPLRVAVNISMDNLSSLAFPESVVQAATKAGVDTSSLLLEVTESRLMNDRQAQLEILSRLSLKHIGLSIDDFGTGHSTFVQLRDIPFNELKVDRGFVHGAWRDKSLAAIFQASVSMARQLEMATVAEGVEDHDDWEFLKTTGCDIAQGYFIARPMPGDAIKSWINEWETRRADLYAPRPSP
tara:strand:- start:798 stop:2015 length:1218 start_codon:yes stop_codon:yes gene_type:complete